MYKKKRLMNLNLILTWSWNLPTPRVARSRTISWEEAEVGTTAQSDAIARGPALA